MGSDPIKLRLELNGQTYVLESWHKKKIRNATLDETFNAVMESCKHPHENVAGCVFTEGTQAQHNLDLKAIDNLRGNDE